MKRIFLVFLASCVLLTTACNKKNPSNPDNPSNPSNPNNPSNPVETAPNANTASELIKDQYVDGLKITNVSLVVSGQSSTFVADVVNETGSPVDVLSFNIILKDAEACVKEEYAIAVKKGNTELLETVNRLIQEMKTSGELDDIISNYIK